MKKKLYLITMCVLCALNGYSFIQNVTVQNHFFSPSSFTINLGDTVRWTWIDGSHTTTSLTIPAGAATWDKSINSSSTTFTYVPSKVGTYNYKCTPHFAMGMTGSFTVVCPQATAQISAASSTVFCNGGSVLLKSAVSSFITSFQWKKNGTSIAGATGSTFTATALGSYTLMVTNSCGNSATSNAISVTVKPLPAATITPAGAVSICARDTAVLQANTGASLVYQWIRNGVNIAGATSGTLKVTITGNYRVLVTNTATGCSKTSPTTTVMVNPLPVATITPSGPVSICNRDTAVLQANTGASLAYQWNRNGVNIAGATSSTFKATITGNYRVLVTNTATGCSKASPTTTVMVNPLPAATITPSGSVSICKGDTSVLQANTGPSLTYQWSRNGVDITGATSRTFKATITGNYRVLVINTTTGCRKLSPTTTVTVTTCFAPTVKTILKNEIEVYPNPSTSGFYISIPSYAGNGYSLAIFDAKGMLVGSKRITSRYLFFGTDLKPGIYFVEVKKANILMAKEKIVKQ